MIIIEGYLSKVQVIERADLNRQSYLICPAPLRPALELEKGEEIEWIVEDKATLLKRPAIAAAKPLRPGHGK